MSFKFPYGNLQQLNLNWFIKKFQELVTEWNNKEQSIDGALQDEIERAEDALSDVFTARDVTVAAKNVAVQAKIDALTASANAAQYWQNAANAAQSAATSAVNALNAANDASADAAQVAADRAAVAADKATVAADRAAVAADKATVAQDKADTDDIKDAANAAGLRAEGWADGTQNGTPVTSDSPYYENNAKYYKEQAEAVATSIPADYTALSAQVAQNTEDIKDSVESFWSDIFTKHYNYAALSRAGKVNGLKLEGLSSAASTTGLALPIHGHFTGAFNYYTWSAASGLTVDDFIEIPSNINDFSIYVEESNNYTNDHGSSAGIAFAIYTISSDNVISRVLAPADSNNRYNRGVSIVLNNVLSTYPQIRTNGKIFILPIWYRTGGANRNISCKIILKNVNTPERTGYLTPTNYSELQMAATRAYVVNDIIAVGNYLYLVTAPISSGAQIIAGTNVRRVYITSLLSELLKR